MRAQAIVRIRFISAAIIIISIILLARLYQIQVVHSDTYRKEAEEQYVHTVRSLYERGSIFFTTRNGEPVSAATIQTGYLLAIDATKIDNPESTYNAISTVFELDKEEFLKRANNKERTYQEIEPQVSNENAAKIESLGLSGVNLYRNQWRYYPGNELSARTVGFVGYNGDELSGRYGLERYYDDVLERDDEGMAVNFFAEIFTNLGDLVFDTSHDREGDIYTSIEPTVARTLDRILEETHDTWNSRTTGGIIIRPQTGEVVALGVTPTFDLNDRGGVDISEFRNPLVEDVHEFGSIIKPLTVAAGIDYGAITPQTTYYDAGYIELNDFTIRNYDGKGRGYVNMQEVLNQSLNTGVSFIVKEMGKEHFRDYFLNLKLGTETGIDLPNEIHGLVNNLNSPRDVEYATASFGQGIALTPIAATRALSTLANGGKLVTPHIATKVLYDNGKVRDVGFPEGEHVYSEETAETVTRMLVNVVDDALMGGTVSLPNYTVAAKTGTAQIADHVDGGYYDDKFLHSFFGYFPAYDPEFLIFLYTVEPKEVRYASETLTKPFMEMTQFLINYYNIPPDR